MQKQHFSTLALVSGLGLLTACPPGGGGGTETETDTDTSTSGSTSTTTTTTTTTTTNPTEGTTDTPTTEGPTTGSTTDQTTGSTTDVSSTSSSTGPMPTTLCERLGGEAGIGDLINTAFGVLLTDDKVNGYFLNNDVDATNLGACLVKQVGELATCPGVTYDCMDMKSAHMGLGISTNDFMDFAADFSAALDMHQGNNPDLTDQDKMDILAALGGMAPDIVEDANNDLTVYQRVGRKPAIRALIGKPMEAMSFVDNVANDAAINGFFGMTDFDRLNTCLTRQVGGIDGPTKYGLEVDAPAPADPGVGVGNECKDMATAHMGLQDANDMIGIDINDFGALVMDLVTAMNSFMVAQPDQDAILGVLSTLCDPILDAPFKNQCPENQKLETVEVTMINGPIPDNGYNGTVNDPMKIRCQDIVVPADPLDIVESVELTVGVNHTWVADLTMKLVHPDGMKILTLVSRPTYAEAADDGNGCCGKGPNLSSMFPLTFKNGAANDAELMGNTLQSTQTICKDDNVNPCEFKPNPGKGPGMNLDDFKGMPATGTWKFCVGDSNTSDVGNLSSVKLVIKRVKYDPTP